MKVLVTGVTGQLGYDVYKECLKRGYEVVGCGRKDEYNLEYYQKLDLLNITLLEEKIKEINPDVIIHCAAWTKVDDAEKEENKNEVFRSNYSSTKNLAKICHDLDAKMIYLSTDYVFDGLGNKPWSSDSKTISPLNYYGLSKSAGEDAVRQYLDKYYIVRISWVFGINGKNFLKTMLSVSKNHDEVKVVNNQIGRPTYTKDLARLLLDMASKEEYGIYHATNEGEYISWYDLTKYLYQEAGINTKVTPVTTEEYGTTLAKRPKNSRLDTSKLQEKGFEPLPDWQDAVKRYLKELNIEKEKESEKMSQINVSKCPIEGLYEITPTVHGDDRGYFMETYNANDMASYGLDMKFVQDNQSCSKKGVLRGLHFQKEYPQGKLVRVINGKVFDVAVDLRENSSTYGKWYGVILSAENKKQFYIPEGFAHGFLVLSDTAEFCYKCTDFYHPGDESGLAWNDPNINIAWPEVVGNYPGNADASNYTLEDGTPLSLSEKDQKWLTLERTFKFKR